MREKSNKHFPKMYEIFESTKYKVFNWRFFVLSNYSVKILLKNNGKRISLDVEDVIN